MGYSLDPISANCYPNTTVLENRFNIREQSKLDEVESVITTARIAECLQTPKVDSFDFSHYKQVHNYIFKDLYDWAGQVRTVNISKKGTDFCPAAEIEAQGKKIFERLASVHFFAGLSYESFLEELVDFYCATNYLHPFREGNGRTQRVFLSQLSEHAGFHLDFSTIDTDLLMMATIQSAHGVTDLLKRVLGDAISEL